MKKYVLTGLLTGLMATLFCIISTPALARSIRLEDAGIALWIFIIIGAVIVLLQFIPAAILLFTFIGTTTGLIVKKKSPEKMSNKEKVRLPGYEPATAEK